MNAKLIAHRLSFLMALSVFFMGGVLQAQMIQIATPNNNFTDSNYERMGVDFGFQLQGGRGPGSRTVGLLPGMNLAPNIAFRQNGAAAAIPQFGGYNPNADGTFGFTNIDGGNRLSLGLTMGQGSTRTNTSTVPSVVMQNGTTGSIFSGTVQPFVTGFIPVVGDIDPRINNIYVERPNHLREMLRNMPVNSQGYSDLELNGSRDGEFKDSAQGVSGDAASTATIGAKGVDKIRAERDRRLAAEAAALRAEVQALIAKAETSEEAGKTVLARSYYRSALQKMNDSDADDELRVDIAGRIEKLMPKKKD